MISPLDNLPGVWNDSHSVAADDDVDDVDVDPRQRHLPLSHCALRTKIYVMTPKNVFFSSKVHLALQDICASH